MARTSRVVLNRGRLAAVRLALADGMLDVAEQVLEETRAPDAPPLGLGLVLEKGTLLYVSGKKVGGTATKKPRAVKTPPGVVVAVAGFGFPGRFQEFGTVNQPARPFLTPARNRVLPRINEILKRAMVRKF